MASGLSESGDLIVEDGSIVAGANSYSDIATADAYVNLRQDAMLAPWISADESNRVAALIIATDYVDTRWCYVSAISDPGTDVLAAQDLQWPRLSVTDSRGVAVADDEIPQAIIDATIEYAARAINSTTLQAQALLVDSVTQDPSGRFITETLKQVGPLKTQTKYSDGKGTKTNQSFGNADRIIRLSGFVAFSGSTAIRG